MQRERQAQRIDLADQVAVGGTGRGVSAIGHVAERHKLETRAGRRGGGGSGGCGHGQVQRV